MNTGERIKTARNFRGMTMKELGEALDYPYKSADIRISQYETGKRSVRRDVIDKMAAVLNVSPEALIGPEGYEENDVMRILFDLEERGYEIDIHKKGERVVVEILANGLTDRVVEWKKVKTRLKLGRMSERAYLEWKLCWPDNIAGTDSREQNEVGK